MLRTMMCVLLAIAALTLQGCRREAPAYTPGLGEIMTLQQMRHTKLWFAGQAGNWPLADYEIKEIKEGFDDAVTFHPTLEDAPLPIKDIVPKKVTVPLNDLAAAVMAHDQARFVMAYDELTMACNECHEAENFKFNVVQRPATNPYADQVFAAAK